MKKRNRLIEQNFKLIVAYISTNNINNIKLWSMDMDTRLRYDKHIDGDIATPKKVGHKDMFIYLCAFLRVYRQYTWKTLAVAICF